MIHSALSKKPSWIESDPSCVIEQALLEWCRRLGHTVNLIAGAYTVKDSAALPYSGGVMAIDWAQGNLQESPKVLSNYFRELKRPWVWWSERRHEPGQMLQIMHSIGLEPIDRVYGMSFATPKLKLHQRPEKWHTILVENRREMAKYGQLFCDHIGYSREFASQAWSCLRAGGLNAQTMHHIALFKGRPVAFGSFYSFASYGWISHLGVVESQRQHGFGTLLLEELIACAWAEGLEHLCVLVPQDARAFFAKAGFQQLVEFDLYASPEVFTRIGRS